MTGDLRLALRTLVRQPGFSAVVILTLHIVEVTIWAGVYFGALPDAAGWSFEQAVYFSLVTFTTLGYGEITLGPDLRLLSGIEALNGIVLVGWSTAFLFALLERIWRASAAGSWGPWPQPMATTCSWLNSRPRRNRS